MILTHRREEPNRLSFYQLIRDRIWTGASSSEALPILNSAVKSIEKRYELQKHTGCVNTIAWNETGTKLVSGSDDRSIVIWGGDPLEVLLSVPTGHRNNVFCASFVVNCGDLYMVTSAADGCAHLLDVENGRQKVLYDGDGSGFCFKHVMEANNPSQTGLVTISDGNVVRFDLRGKRAYSVVNIRQDLNLRQLSMGRFTAPPSGTAIEFNPIMPEVVALGTSTKAVLLFDVRKFSTCLAKVVPEFTQISPDPSPGETEAVSGLAWDKRNRLIVNYCRQSVVEMDFSMIQCKGNDPVLYRVGSTCEIPRQWTGRANHQTFLKEVALFGNGDYVVTGGDCGNIYIWERFGNQKLILKQAADPHVLNCVAPHPFIPIIASSGIASFVSIWSPSFRGPSENEDEN